ncbi:MAG: TonB-dependent receptor plug domain-containing protein [Terriglobales bacterium]
MSTTGTLNFKLQVGASTQTVQVTGEAALLQPQNANTSTTLDSKAIENLPNPGGDITMLEQIAPGAEMHVQGGGGTAGLSYNGVPGNAVNYTVDGMDDNDPFNNDNNSGPSNMLLGSNAVSEVTVNTTSYSVDQGRMAAGQVNYLSKSGSNGFHGNASYQWNGRTLNAYDFFVKSQPLAAGQSLAPKPFDNVNNWAASVGGPIVKNKLFFFVDSEGTRIDLPHVASYTAPSPAFEAYAATQLPQGGYDTSITVGDGKSTYRFLPGNAAAAPWMTQIFGLYGDTSVGTHGDRQITPNTSALFGCNILASGAVDSSYNPQMMPNDNQFLSDGVTTNPVYNPIPSDTGCETRGILTTSAKTPETLTSFRIDWTVKQNNTVWGKYSDDQGTQTTGVSAINPVFDENSFQPDHQGVLDWTHVFSPNLTNDASTGFLWYSAIFDFNTPTNTRRFPGWVRWVCPPPGWARPASLRAATSPSTSSSTT